MMKTKLSLCTGLFLILFAGCEKQVPHNDYFPLRDGNHWEYRLLDRPLLKRMAAGETIVTAPLESADARKGDDDPIESDVPKAEVVPDTGKKDAPPQASARRVVLELGAQVDEITYKATYDQGEQVWSKRNGYVGFQSVRGRSYLLILPPHTNYKWVVTGPAGQDLYYQIESGVASVSTPAGVFPDCALARQESRDRKEVFKYWFAPDVGLVRRSKYFMGEEVFRQELVSFKVNKATPAARIEEEKELRRALSGNNRGSEFRNRRKDATERDWGTGK